MSDEFDIDPDHELTFSDLVSNNTRSAPATTVGTLCIGFRPAKPPKIRQDFAVYATVDDDDLIKFTVNGEEVIRRSHDTDRLAAALFYTDRRAFWKPDFRILSVKSSLGRYYFNVATLDEWKPCRE